MLQGYVGVLLDWLLLGDEQMSDGTIFPSK